MQPLLTPQDVGPWIQAALLGASVLVIAGCAVLEGPRWLTRRLPLTDYGRDRALAAICLLAGLTVLAIVVVLGMLEAHRVAG